MAIKAKAPKCKRTISLKKEHQMNITAKFDQIVVIGFC